MRKVLIGLAALVGAITALGVSGTLCLNYMIAVNRDRIVRQIERELGRPASVERMTISLWRGLGVQVDAVRIGDDPRFGDGEFVRASTVVVGAELWPLLRLHFVPSLIDARDLSVRLIRDASGRWNYETLGANRQDAPPFVPAPGTPTRFALSAARLRLRGIDAGLAGMAHPASGDGGIAAEIRDVRIDQFNLVATILERVSGVRGIGSLISSKAKPKYARLVTEPGMAFEVLRGSFRAADQRLNTDDLVMVAPDYAVQGRGWIGFDRNVDLSGTLVMSKQFTDEVIADVKLAKYLANADGQLAVPFRLRGRIGEVEPKPDAAYLQAALERAARGTTQHLLEHLLGSRSTAQPGTAADQPRNALEKGLRDLLGH